jgi:hypothetical protein
MEIKLDEHKLSLIRSAFPFNQDSYHMEIYNLNLESVENYGIMMPIQKIYDYTRIINSLNSEFPNLIKEGSIEPEYVRSAYIFISIIHNLHKVNSKLISTQDFYHVNSLYKPILGKLERFDSKGYSMSLIDEKEIRMTAANALSISTRIKAPASESTYLEIILALQEKFDVEEQWKLLTRFPYEQIIELDTIPSIYLDKLLED